MTCSLTDEQRKEGLLCRAMDCEQCKKYRAEREDIVNKPAHYNTGKIEVANFIEDKNLDFFDGNVVKYISRAKHKGSEISDKEKALWYLMRGLIQVKGEEAGLKAIEKSLKHFKDEKENAHTVRACHDSEFHGIACLEDDTRFGFFKGDGDVRPSSCIWIDKDKVERVYQILINYGFLK